LAIQSQQAFVGITRCRLEVSESGDVHMPVDSAAIDFPAWQRAQWSQSRSWQREAAEEYEPPIIPAVNSAGDSPFRSIAEALREGSEGKTAAAQRARALLAVDNALLATHGYGLDAVFAVLATAMAWQVPSEPEAPLGVTTRDHIVGDVSRWARLDPGVVAAAVDALTLSSGGLREEGFSYWKLEQRSNRLAARPLIAPPYPTTSEELWVLPRAAYYTRGLWVSYFHDGRLPLPKAQLGAQLQRALHGWRRLSEEALEREVERVAVAAKLYVKATLKPEDSGGIPLAGEVDLLAADTKNKRLYVVEAKHLEHPFSPPEVAFNAVDLHGADVLDYSSTGFRPKQASSKHRPPVAQLRLNAEVVNGHLAQALAVLGVPETGAGTAEGPAWSIVPLVVTTGVEVGAFVANPQVPFMTLEGLERLLESGAEARPGWWTADAEVSQEP